jgi:glycine oxidase
MKTVIIGNGIIAQTTALRLGLRAKDGDEIVIIGKLSKPGSATNAAGAMLNSFCEVEHGSMETEVDLFRFELSYMAGKMWPQFVLDHLETAMAHNCLIPECATCMGPTGACFEMGTYLINNCSSDSLDDSNYNAVIKALKDYNETYFEVTANDIPNYKPAQKHRATRAIYIPNEGWLNPKLTLRSIEASLYGFKSIKFIDEEVESLFKNGDLIDGVKLKTGEIISGDKYLLTTGATVGSLIEKSNLGITIPTIFHSVGVSLQIQSPRDPAKKVIRTPNRGLACGLYTVPFYTSPKVPLDELLIGSSSYVTTTPNYNPRVGSVSHLLNSAIDQINTNFYRAEVTCINVGSRPLSADTYPVVGRSSIKNLIIATGTKRDGFHLSPVLSEVLTNLIHDEEIDPRWEMFSPERALIRNQSRSEAIEMSVLHLLSASYQHGFEPSHDTLHDKIAEMHRSELEKLHDQVGAIDWGIPAELLDMYRYGHIKA